MCRRLASFIDEKRRKKVQVRDRNFKLNFDLVERSLQGKLNVLFANRCLFDNSSCKKKRKKKKRQKFIYYRCVTLIHPYKWLIKWDNDLNRIHLTLRFFKQTRKKQLRKWEWNLNRSQGELSTVKGNARGSDRGWWTIGSRENKVVDRRAEERRWEAFPSIKPFPDNHRLPTELE